MSNETGRLVNISMPIYELKQRGKHFLIFSRSPERFSSKNRSSVVNSASSYQIRALEIEKYVL